MEYNAWTMLCSISIPLPWPGVTSTDQAMIDSQYSNTKCCPGLERWALTIGRVGGLGDRRDYRGVQRFIQEQNGSGQWS